MIHIPSIMHKKTFSNHIHVCVFSIDEELIVITYSNYVQYKAELYFSLHVYTVAHPGIHINIIFTYCMQTYIIIYFTPTNCLI